MSEAIQKKDSPEVERVKQRRAEAERVRTLGVPLSTPPSWEEIRKGPVLDVERLRAGVTPHLGRVTEFHVRHMAKQIAKDTDTPYDPSEPIMECCRRIGGILAEEYAGWGDGEVGRNARALAERIAKGDIIRMGAAEIALVDAMTEEVEKGGYEAGTLEPPLEQDKLNK